MTIDQVFQVWEPIGDSLPYLDQDQDHPCCSDQHHWFTWSPHLSLDAVQIYWINLNPSI